MRVIKQSSAVEPANPSTQQNELLTLDVESSARQTVTSQLPPVDRSRCRDVGAWLAPMRFQDRKMEWMYDRYMVKFNEYSANMLIMILSLVCLTELVFYFVAGATYHLHVGTTILLLSFLVILILTLVIGPSRSLCDLAECYRLARCKI